MDILVLFGIAYPIPYLVSRSESDIFIRRIPSNQIWILQNRFGNKFGAKIILSPYTYTHLETRTQLKQNDTLN
jgi:hypothetical protein